MLMPLPNSEWNLTTLSFKVSLHWPLLGVLNFLIGELVCTVYPSSTVPCGFLDNPDLNLSSVPICGALYWLFSIGLFSVRFRGEIKLLKLLDWYPDKRLPVLVPPGDTGELGSSDSFVYLTNFIIFLSSSPNGDFPVWSIIFPSFDIFNWNNSIHSILFWGSLVKIFLKSFLV